MYNANYLTKNDNNNNKNNKILFPIGKRMGRDLWSFDAF